MLDLDRVGFAYTPGKWVFREVSLNVPAGSVVAVLGPNGRGKTTLLRCAAGLLRLREGSVRRDRPVGFVPQAHGTAFGYRVADMVLMGRARHIRAYASPGPRDRVAAAQAMERVGVLELAQRSFSELSGGEQQLVLIARAVASGSGVLVLDEPAAALDLRNQGRVLALLRELADDGLAVLLTTHHPGQALDIADGAVLMMGPDRVLVGPAGELLTEAALTELYDVEVRTIGYEEDGVHRQILVTRYGPGRR